MRKLHCSVVSTEEIFIQIIRAVGHWHQITLQLFRPWRRNCWKLFQYFLTPVLFYRWIIEIVLWRPSQILDGWSERTMLQAAAAKMMGSEGTPETFSLHTVHLDNQVLHPLVLSPPLLDGWLVEHRHLPIFPSSSSNTHCFGSYQPPASILFSGASGVWSNWWACGHPYGAQSIAIVPIPPPTVPPAVVLIKHIECLWHCLIS